MTKQLFVYLDPTELSRVKEQLRSGNQDVIDAVAKLTAEANRLRTLVPTSVLDKTGVAASNDPHDFYAIGGYSWPNPSTPDGLPYQYRDSETNPEALVSDEYDKGRYEEMSRQVGVLALAYYYSSDTSYAGQAAELLRTWFINSETKMNPNFRYAAARPGIWDGHFSGVIEGVFLIELLDFVALLERSPAWTESDDTNLRAWFRELSEWLAHSQFGKREIFSANNHGSYLLAQLLAFATYGGESRRARGAITLARSQLRRQFRSDGRMPLEIDRADGWFYSVYGLRAFALLARLAEYYGYDLWKERDSIIVQSCTSLAPYLTGASEWPFSRGKKPWEHDAVQVYHMAARKYESADLLSTATWIVENAVEPLPHARLLGLYSTSVSKKHSDIPPGRAWSDSKRQRGPRLLIEGQAWRVLGVLAARNKWHGRHVP